jgi:hypothetical protein
VPSLVELERVGRQVGRSDRRVQPSGFHLWEIAQGKAGSSSVEVTAGPASKRVGWEAAGTAGASKRGLQRESSLAIGHAA